MAPLERATQSGIVSTQVQETAGPFSFRDPGGVLVQSGDRMRRIVNAAAARDFEFFLASRLARDLKAARSLVGTSTLDSAQADEWLQSDDDLRRLCESRQGALILEHERIPFPSFPYEWPAQMLHAAGALTLDLARRGLEENIGLKDATPLNVLFAGPRPVFVDVLSFERRDPRDSTWLPHAQFLRTFALPLLAWKYLRLSPGLLITRRDGLEPEEVYGWISPFDRLRPPFLQMVSLPTWLGKRELAERTHLYERKLSGNPEKARFILAMLLDRLQRSFAKLRPPEHTASAWSGYATHNSYSDAQAETKQRFVADALSDFSPRNVLDIGCNTGQYSVIAARGGASVVAIDYDPVVVGSLWSTARSQKLDILPLVVNLGHPTPATGWRNEEFPSFLDRARGHFDAVLMLAVLHHLLVTDRVPLESVLATAAELTRDLLIIEFVGTGDPMFRKIARGRDALHADLTPSAFEAVAGVRFELVRRQPIEGSSRILYLYRKKTR